MKEDQGIKTPQISILSPDTDVPIDPHTLGIYLEIPTHSRRRRSLQATALATSDLNIFQDSFTHSFDDNFVDEELFDSPRLFTELLILSLDENSQTVWKEAARWVRFEEDVEEEGERWSKPRVSTLSLHSFFELRSFLLNGVTVLDVEEPGNLSSIFKDAFENLLNRGLIDQDEMEQIGELLKLRCVHLFEITKGKEVMRHQSLKKKYSKNKEKTEIKMEEQLPLKSSSEENGNYKGNKQFLKKLQEGTEAANILIGEVNFLKSPVSIFIRLKNKTNLGSLTEVPVETKFIFLLLGPKSQQSEINRYKEIGRSFATLLSDEVFREVAYKGKSKSHILAGMDEFLDASTLLPPGEWDPDIRIEPPEEAPTKESRKRDKSLVVDKEDEERRLREEAGLTQTGRLFGGLINDIKRKAPWYKSDFFDGISLQSAATFFFIYFACLTPIVTFGGLLGEVTKNNIAVIESLVAGLISGILYGLFSGQPLTILGSTGPVLVFESIVFEFCKGHDWNYLSFRMWIGIWAAVILIILVAVDASALVCYITRFTEENFATLIALIFVFKAVEKVVKIGKKYPFEMHVEDPKLCSSCSFNFENEVKTLSNVTYKECLEVNGELLSYDCPKYYPDVFLLSLILFAGTFVISVKLKNFKMATFFPNKVRSFISDFAVIIAIILMTGVDLLLGVNTPKLWVPSELKPTNPNRGWLIYPFNGNPWWTSLVACLPALLACILIFMDQQITAVIVNRKEHKLKKGCGYHLDLLIVACLIAINSIMGLPWFVAATVLSINHVNSLKEESECAAPGEKPQFLGVKENRLTHTLIFLFIGLSVFIAPLLNKIPMAVLFGVFMYMGISALKGIQLFERILLIFMPLKYQPDHTYLKKVPLKTVHCYTLIQVACLVILWIIKSVKKTSILFPLMLVIMIGIRKLLDQVFTQRELKLLDDALPEFTRRKKIEEGEDEEEDEVNEEEERRRMENKRERLMSISMKNGGVTPAASFVHLSMTDEVNKNPLWAHIDNLTKQQGSNASSRRSSLLSKQRRRSSLLEPIFGAHNYQAFSYTASRESVASERPRFQRSYTDSRSDDRIVRGNF